jgi:hypothetical protein
MKSLTMSLGFLLAFSFSLPEVFAQIDESKSVLTQHNDHWRRGAYLAETILNPSNVTPEKFGHRYSLKVDGPILAQPLFAKGAQVRGKERDVLYVATRMNKLYAFDVDQNVPDDIQGDPAKDDYRLIWERELPDVPPVASGQPVTAVWRDKIHPNDKPHLDLFIAGKDGEILSNYWDEGPGWNNWFSIRPDTGVAAAGMPQQVTAVWGDPNNAQHLNLFMTDRDGTVKSIYCTILPNQPCWKNETWFSIGSPHISLPGQPVTAVWRDINHLDLFVAGKEGEVLSNFWDNGTGWHEWFPIRRDTGVTARGAHQQITAVWGDPNHGQHLNLFMTANDGSVKTIFCTIQQNQPCWQEGLGKPAWSAIGRPGLAPPGQPVTAVWRDAVHLDLFIAGINGDVLSNYWENDSGWHEWFSIRRETGSVEHGHPQQITAVWGDPIHAHHLNLFIRADDGAIKSIYCTILPQQPCWQEGPGNPSWYAISSVSGTTTVSQPVTAIWRDGAFSHLDLFATGNQATGQTLRTVADCNGRPTAVPVLCAIPGQDVGPDQKSYRYNVILSNYWENVVSWGSWFPVPLRAEALPGMDDGPLPTCGQTHGPVGITSTPVIDAKTNTMYVVYRTGSPPDVEELHHLARGGNDYRFGAQYWLAAIDIVTGLDRRPPVLIATPSGETLEFDATLQLNRAGLLLQEPPLGTFQQPGSLIVAFGSAVCDHGGNPYKPEAALPKGWVFAFATPDLARQAVFVTAIDKSDTRALAGIWQSGNGLAADKFGFIYAFTGNYGDSSKKRGEVPSDLSESILRLKLEGGAFSFGSYRVAEAYDLDRAYRDGDLGAGGPMFPVDHLLVGGGKQGVLYAITNPGGATDWSQQPPAVQKFQAFFNGRSDVIESHEQDPLQPSIKNQIPDTTPNTFVKVPKAGECTPGIIQEYGHQMDGPNIHGAPVAWKSKNAGVRIYAMPEKDFLRAFEVNETLGTISHCPAITTQGSDVQSPLGMPGGFLSISANGDSGGLVWASVAIASSNDASTTFGRENGRLIALDALTLEKVWEDTNDPGAVVVPFAKFVPPTIAAGHVFRAAYKDKVHVYGLKQ